METQDKTITYILRCHSVSTLPKLKTALLSVAAQQYDHVEALVAVQNLSDDDVDAIRSNVQILQDATGRAMQVVNFEFPTPGDYRGALLNRAIAEVKTRYIAFLDYDDVIYPNHARVLVSDLVDLEDQGAAASFGDCVEANYDDISDGAINITSKKVFRKVTSVSHCVLENCFPIHCYVIDLHRLHVIPKFGEESHILEDYLFLLSLFEHHPVSTRQSKTPVCEYRINNDNSNTVVGKRDKSEESLAKIQLWKDARAKVAEVKSMRSYRIPYEEIARSGIHGRLSRQPFFRGLFICQMAKRLRKRQGLQAATEFLADPKVYVRALPREKRTVMMKILF